MGTVMIPITSVIRSSSIADLNGMGNNLYNAGNSTKAIETYDSAITLVKTAASSLKSPFKGGEFVEQVKRQGAIFHTQGSQAIQLPPDCYFEGECDVGPRAFYCPIHLNSGALTDEGAIFIEAALQFNKGIVLHSSGDLEPAAGAYGQALRSLSRSWSAGLIMKDLWLSSLCHIRTLIHNNLGQIRYTQADDRNALFHFQTALELSREVILEENDQEYWALTMATIYSNIARTKWMMGDSSQEDLMPLFGEVLRLRSLFLATSHQDVLAAHMNLGLMFYLQNDKMSAMLHFEEYLKVAITTESSLDPIPAVCYMLMMEYEGKDDRLSVELVRSVRALLDTREDFGAVNAEVASLLNYIGTILFHRRELQRAILFYKEELKLEHELAEGNDGISVSVTYNNIGRILQELGQLNEAIDCYQQALKTEGPADVDCSEASALSRLLADQSFAFKETMSESTLNLFSTIWYNVGLIHDRMGSRTEAISAFKMSLQLRQALYGNDHQDVACLHYNIGTLQMESLQLDEAFLSLRETLRIKRLGSFKEDPDKIFSTISKLARLQEGKGRIKEALLTRQEMLELLTSSPQVKQEALSETLLRMSQLYHATGELSRAMGLAQISLEALMQCDILREVIVTDFNNYISTVEMAAKSMMYIGSLYHELVDLENARGVFEHARTFVFHVVNHYGATQGTSQLIPMLEVLHQLSVPSCAPQA